MHPHKYSRRFTPHEANRMLPLLRSIVRDIEEKGTELRALVAEGRGHSSAYAKAYAQVMTFVDEIHSLGCCYNDWGFTVGLVNFPAVIKGEDVLLSWRGDEELVAFYHPYDTGFSGRRALAEDHEPSEALQEELGKTLS